MKKSSLLFFSLLLMGAAFLLAGGYEFSNRLDLSQNGLKTEGIVIHLKTHHTKKGVSYKPEVQFITQTGQIVRFVHPASSNPSSYSIGQKVHIIYSPHNPVNAVLDSKLSLFGIPLIFIFVGIVILLLDFGIVIKERNNTLPPAA